MKQSLQQIVRELDKRIEELQQEVYTARLCLTADREKARRLEHDAKQQARQLREASDTAMVVAARKLEKVKQARDTLTTMMHEQEDPS